MKINKLFYIFKPLIPRQVQLFLRRQIVSRQRKYYENIWPIDEKAKKKPENWTGWPKNRKFAVVLTHDVESDFGQNNCIKLMNIERDLGFCSSFNFVPERYKVSQKIRHELTENGFEVGVHGLNHDGNLFKSKEIFLARSKKINEYIKDWQAVGFRSPAMHHNLDWIHELNISYDLSTFDTDPFEPQPDGVSTIFPFYVNGNDNHQGYMELPYTLAQDFTLYVLMKEPNIDIWKKKVDWIVQNKGMVLVNVHPDYISFENDPMGPEQFPIKFYTELLTYIKTKYKDEYWHDLPKNVAQFCLKHHQTNGKGL